MHDSLPIPARSPTTSLLADRHQEIDALLEDVRALTGRHSYVTAAKRFGELFRAIEEHARIEEEIWLPRIAERWPDRLTTFDHVREDHRAIRAQMDQVAQALAGWHADEAEAGLAELAHRLDLHHAHEDTEIYPAVVALKMLGSS